MKNENKTIAYLRGYNAALNGVVRDKNPFRGESPTSEKEWFRGYDDAMSEAKKEQGVMKHG